MLRYCLRQELQATGFRIDQQDAKRRWGEFSIEGGDFLRKITPSPISKDKRWQIIMWGSDLFPLPPLEQGNHRESLPHLSWGEHLLSSNRDMKSYEKLWRLRRKESVFFGLSSWFETGNASIMKPKNPCETHQKTHLDAERFNVMPRIEMTDLESPWIQKKPDLTACECWKSTRNTTREQRISGVGLGWFYDLYWSLWCTLGLIKWNFAVTGGAEYCRVTVSIQWNDMRRKHEGHLGTWCHVYLFAILCL